MFNHSQNLSHISATSARVGQESLAKYWMDTYWQENGDPRLSHFPLMGSFTPFLTILGSYALFVLYLGPKMMQNRPAYSLKPLMIGYNFFMAGLNLYFIIIGSHTETRNEIFKRVLDLRYPPWDWNNKWEMYIIRYNHLYLCSKLVDLLDTVFFVLRKKQSQVTPLHFYHHISVPLFGWIYFRLNGVCTLLMPFCTMNAFLHVAMYSYYGLAAMGPHMRRYLWWKQYLTLMQICQFVVLFWYGAYFVLFQQGYPPFLIYNHMLQASLYFFLFAHFYMKTYQKDLFMLGKFLGLGNLYSEKKHNEECEVKDKVN